MNKYYPSAKPTYRPLSYQRYGSYLPQAFDNTFTILEKVNRAIWAINNLGDSFDDLSDRWDEVMKWLLNDGVDQAVIDKLNEMKDDGELDDLINEVLFETKPTFEDQNASDVYIAGFFKNNTDIGVRWALSTDGETFKQLDSLPQINGRDADIHYENGKFYVVVTGYNPHDFSLYVSDNMRDWERHNISLGLWNNANSPKIWAPEFFKDETDGKLYVMLSRQMGTGLDIYGDTIGTFVPYIVEIVDLETLSFGTPRTLGIGGNVIDPHIINNPFGLQEGYYCLIKDEYDKKCELYYSLDLFNWQKQSDDLIPFNNTDSEGYSTALIEDTLYIYADYYATGGNTHYTTTKDLVNFSPSIPINYNSTSRHASIRKFQNRDVKMTVNDYESSGVKRSELVLTDLKRLTTTAQPQTIVDFKPIEGRIYCSYNADGVITIENIVNSYNTKVFHVALRSGSGGGIIIKGNGDIELPRNLEITSAIGNNDYIYTFRWIEGIGKFKVEGTDVRHVKNQIFADNRVVDCHTRISLTTIAASGGTINNFDFVNGAVYTVSGAETMTIASVRPSFPGERFFLCVASDNTAARITVTRGSGIALPSASKVIGTQMGMGDTIYEMKRIQGSDAMRFMGGL